jgi:thiol-disulfide isomerase/thioredoxin
MNLTNQSDPASHVDDSTSQPTPTRKHSSTAFLYLMAAGLFMVTGVCVLLFIGREKARIIGQTISDLDIQPLLNADKPITTADMQGKVVVIHFWGFWCTHCHAEHGSILKVQNKYKDDPKVLFVSVSCSEKQDDTKDALQFYTKKYLTINGGDEFPIYYDPVEFSRSEISKLLTSGGFSYPTTLVLDSSGKVVEVWRSVITDTTLSKAIDKAKLSKQK